MSEFENKVVLITGAGRGMGRELALAFAAQGAVLALNDINPLSLDDLAGQCIKAGGRAHTYCFDVAKRMPVMALVSEVVEELGRIDIAIHNAAVEPVAAVLDMDEWDWHRTIDVNLSGAFFVMQQAGRVMRQQGGGVMVNIGANQSHVQEQRSAYLASKEGLLCLTRQVAIELAQENIRVHAVCPGKVSAQETTLLIQQNDGKPENQKTFENVAELVLFLCSQQAANLTGLVIKCDENRTGGQDVQHNLD